MGRWDDLRQTVNSERIYGVASGRVAVDVVLRQGKRKRKDAQLATDTQMWRGEVAGEPQKGSCQPLHLHSYQKWVILKSSESNFTFL